MHKYCTKSQAAPQRSTVARAPTGTTRDAKCVTEILGGKIRKLGAQSLNLVSRFSEKNNCCHQMSFMAKMHQIRFWLGLRAIPAGGVHSDPQTL